MSRPTPETDALDCELHTPRVLQDRYSEMRDHAQKLERERNEAREKLDEEMKWHHRTHTELVQTQCKILDMQMGRDEIQEKYDNLATEHMLAVNRLAEERNELREDLEFRRELYRVQEECLENAREEVKELIYIAGRAIDLADLDFENDKFGVVSELRSDLDKIKEETK